ncbi:MAG: Stp1/IreP family PP2C-type Ser/Thr phosphatase [Acidobacteria bacterium]|nr:MAG: Stp1/IreP family PP2C-type Ser/Thr phosphatase [Acidobacteriota bacterium]
MKIHSAGMTDVGRKRDHNEDELTVDADHRLFAVADGMGGHAAGEVASRIAIQSIVEFVQLTSQNLDTTWPCEYDTKLSTDGNLLRTAIWLSNQKICEAVKETAAYKDMGTTVVAVLVSKDMKATVAHVGDSRAYLLRDGEIRQITSDHSWVNEQCKQGFLTPEDAKRHPFRNVVTRALGSRRDVMVDLAEEQLQPGDRVLLCSDGLNSMLDDAAILDAAGNAGDDLEQACRDLIAAANDRGGDDNITVVLVQATS